MVHIASLPAAQRWTAWVIGLVGRDWPSVAQLQTLSQSLAGELRYDALSDGIVYCHPFSAGQRRQSDDAMMQQFLKAHAQARAALMAGDPQIGDAQTRLKSLGNAVGHLAPAALTVRNGEADAVAAGVLNVANAAIFDARLARPLHSSEADALAALLAWVEATLGTAPWALSIRNAIRMQMELVASRDGLPRPWQFAHHDAAIPYLFMDGECHASPWGRYHFENELGYLVGCLRALHALVGARDRAMDAQLLCQLHDLAVAGVYKRSSPPLRDRFRLGYRAQPVEFALSLGRNCSAQGLAEFRRSAAATDGWIEVEPPTQGKAGRLLAHARSPAQCFDKAQDILSHYAAQAPPPANCSMHAELDDAALRTIAQCCQQLNQHHLFTEANIRTIGFLCLNKLLLDQGAAPTILEYPKVLDMCATADIIAAIRRGQQCFQALQAA
ncbi:hypothetical protein [Xanthomonas maliensis]|uniref:hypothetical protein n=1 Tax=Xanthomonas maliensis TaxID=1321368 RepID=UPI001EE34535|nr:hypothetical protein [Xanthomonas maliensis]